MKIKLYSIYKIDSHFKLFYNFNTGAFDKREHKLTSDNFNTSKIHCNKVCSDINTKENLKKWGSQNYCHIKQILI